MHYDTTGCGSLRRDQVTIELRTPASHFSTSTIMNIVTAFLLLSFVSNAEAFPIARSKISVRQKQHRLFSSSDDQIVDSADSADIAQQSEKDVVKEDTEALSGLLGEMFQAKLEMSRENKELESLASQNSDMPVIGGDGIYRIINQIQLE